MLLWACAGVPLGAYNIVSSFNIALLVQPQILSVLSLVTWGQCWYYGGVCVLFCFQFLFWRGEGGERRGEERRGGEEEEEERLMGGVMAGQRQNLQWPITSMGVLSTILLSAGVLRHYYDIYMHRTVRGISFIFVGIDAAGDVFSLVSIFFQSHLDILGIVIYASEFILWCGVFACGAYFNLLPWIRRKMQKRQDDGEAAGNGTVDDVVRVEEGISHDIELERMHSAGSRSVFRTPGSTNSVDRLGQ
ncbi:hypothetical protein SBOR_2130 [Sclerotinia borealis F-4128]|uniref:PQ loop repeat protein n=1 Tax=Sclerotinia borealis (strain F-4128) TaxID=1432307 RepID=W9CNM5_SCLBF|nr:hypothetical protein SBOR_2130 [Sclerotinia borealis F-4128]